MEKKYATYYWWCNLLGVFVVQYKPAWEWSNRAYQALIPCDEKQTLLHESGRNWTVLSKTQNLLLDITVFVQWVWIMTTIKKTKQTKTPRKENPTSFNLVCRKNFGRVPKAWAKPALQRNATQLQTNKSKQVSKSSSTTVWTVLP